MSWKFARLFGIGLAACIGLFIVNTMGFVDAVTGSALGCGKEWPLCNGTFVPSAWGRATLIEYTHRVIAFLAILILVLFSVLSWLKYHKWKEVRVLISVSVVSVLTESILGATTVVIGSPLWLMAFHMGIALTSFASCVLLTFVVRKIEKRTKRASSVKLRGVFLPSFAKWTWITLIYIFAAIYYGAFVSHSGYGALFRGWPFPTENPQEAGIGLWIDYGHRLVAFGVFLLILSLFRRAYRMRWARRDLFIGSLCALILTVLQVFSGAYLVLSNLSIPAFLLHVSFAALLFVSIAFLAMQTLPESRAESRNSKRSDEEVDKMTSYNLLK